MALRIGPALGKVLYGALFTLLLPAAVAIWSWFAGPNVTLPAIESPRWGTVVAALGLLLWATGVAELRIRGGGLPMNAFPPPKLVTSGVYQLIPHPIYTGFTVLSSGLAFLFGSAAGLWLVTPMLGLAAAALWWGYERNDLRARLGRPPRAPWLGVPFATLEAPQTAERLGSMTLALAGPALCSLVLLGAGLAGHSWYLLSETRGRAWVAILLAAGGALAARTCAELRNVVLTSWVGSLLISLFVLLPPAVVFIERRPFAPDGAPLALAASTGVAALLRRFPHLPGNARSALAALAGLLPLARGPIPSPESIVGVLTFVLANGRWRCWQAMLRICEKVANSWGETDLGCIRVIHIGWLASLPAAAGAAAAVFLVGPSGAVLTLCVFLSMIVGSALWAQIIEGSPALSRPYGFFGAVAAVAVFTITAAPAVFHVSIWLVPAVFATLAPWTQGFARLRCLANGCCHGTPCPAASGIIYWNPHTRVVRLAGLAGVPIHPTQLYSLTANVLIGVLMMRFWHEGASFALITGVYLALMGLARFVEEEWRGEPQTPTVAGLRLYQWISIVCIVGGAVLTGLGDSPHAGTPVVSFAALHTGIAVGVITWLAVSIDLPHSNRRFARLA